MDGGPSECIDRGGGRTRIEGDGSTLIVISQIHGLVTSVTRREDVSEGKKGWSKKGAKG